MRKCFERDPRLEIDYVIAPPQMAHYMEVSTKIYHIYLKYVARRISMYIPLMKYLWM